MKNNDNNQKRKSIFKKIAMSTLAIGLLVGVFALNMVKEDPNFSKYRSNYNSDLAYIKTGTPPSDSNDTITMTEAYTDANYSDSSKEESDLKTITIATKEELVKFSNATNDPSKTPFLRHSYKLIDNIDYYGSTSLFVPAGYTLGVSGTAFSGTFDGNGYEISNLTIANPSRTDRSCYAMFWSNSGTIENLGLVRPTLTIGSTWNNPDGGVAFLVGENNGTVQYCFVNDLAYTSNKETLNSRGITAPGARIATLCVNNNSKLSNNYVAVDTVVYNSESNSYLTWAEIALSSTGNVTNCFYYNAAISYFNSGKVYFNSEYSNLAAQDISSYGTYKPADDSNNGLKKALDANWYTSLDYGKYASHVGIEFGIRRGVACDNDVLQITSAKDFAYMYELFNTDDYMASNEATYNITSDINLAKLPVKAYTYKKGIGATIEGTSSDDRSSLTLIDTNKSKFPTIYNAKILDSSRVAVSTGVDCYGLFNYLTGTVKNINVYIDDSDASLDTVSTSSNVKGIGVLSGYIEKGYVDNVNVYADFESTTNIGEYHIGGITGILGGVGVIRNSSAAGSMDLQKVTSSMPGSDGYMNGIAIGGIVGYVEASLGHLNTCTSAVDITCGLGTATTYAIGGIVGAGYTTNYSYDVANNNTTVKVTDRTANLENDGTITVSGDKITYDNLYVAGVIGRHLGMTAQVENFNNSGAINVKTNGNNTYVTGVENADILTTSISNSGMTASELKGKNGKYLFYASSFTNGENITVTGSSNNLHYTNVLNINAKGAIESTIDGIFNLAYNEKYVNGAKKETALTAQSINMNLLNEFAPVLNVVGATSASKTFASTIYNLRDINYAPTANVGQNTTFRYTGVALGDYISYDDVRNEGNLTITLANYTIDSGTKLYVSGIFDTLNLGCTASNLYNGGNITVNEPDGSTATKTFDMYLAGICNQNLAVNSDTKQNPLNAEFDETLNGTLYNAINKGNITVTSENIDKDAKVNENPDSTPHYISNIYVGGITYTNSGIISSAFNLGNIIVDTYTLANNTGKYYEAGGISCLMSGEYAQIRDAANNGDISVVDITNRSYKSIVNIGGIIARNCLQNRSSSAGDNNKQVVAFTINYGTLNAFQSANNMTTQNVVNCHSSAGGILGVGICNLVDIVNYGNVYGNECVGGIVCLVKLGSYNENSINLANTINYGVVKINPQYYAIEGVSNNVYQDYDTVKSLDYIENTDVYYKRTYSGSICSVFDFDGRNDINVRYLINLCKDATTVLYNLNNPSTSPDVSTFITTRGLTDTFGGNNTPIKYADLKAVEDDLGNIGVFSSKFVFRRAIEKDPLVYKPEQYVTDKYIPDFFQFVKFDKVNPQLLETINWRTIAYQSAAEELVKNVGALSTLISKSETQNLLSDAFSNKTWLSTMDDALFESLLQNALKSSTLSSNISDFLNYILFDPTATSSYTTAVRGKIVDVILSYYEKQGVDDYYVILQSLLYDELIAKIISSDDANYANVKSKIEDVLRTADLSLIISTYIDVLKESNQVLIPLFNDTTGTYYEDSKINLIETLLSGFDESMLELIYNSLNTTSSSDLIKYKLYLLDNDNDAKDIYIKLLTFNSLTNSSFREDVNNYVKKYNFTELIDEQIEASNLDSIINTFPNISDLSGYKYTPVVEQNANITTDEYNKKTIQNFAPKNVTSIIGVAPEKDYSSLWNIIKYDSDVQDFIFDSSNGFVRSYTNPTTGIVSQGIIALATEMNNTYQTNDRSQLSFGIDADYVYGINTIDSYYSNHHSKDAANKYMFLYTPDRVVSYRTNYYGPFKDTSGSVFDANGYLAADGTNYNLGMKLNITDDTAGEFSRNVVPLFVSLDRNLVLQKIAESGSQYSPDSTYTFHWHDVNATGTGTGTNSGEDFMWKDFTFVNNYPTNVSGMYYYLYDESGNIKEDATHYIADGFDFSPDLVRTIVRDRATSITLPNGVETGIVNETGNSHTYRQYYLVGHASSSMVTGIWFNYSCYKQKHISLNAKVDTGNTYHGFAGIHTTSYIGYELKDLLALDGLKTKGKCRELLSNNLDEDEINIISTICTKLLSTSAGREKVLKAIANYSSDNTFTQEEAPVLNMLVSSVRDTRFANEMVVSGISKFLSLNYNMTLSVQDFLDNKNLPDDLKSKIIVFSTNNRNNFTTLLIEVLETYYQKCIEYEEYNNYDRNEVLRFICNYFKYKYESNPNIDSSSLLGYINDLSDNDLEIIANLFKLNVTRLDLNNTVYNYDTDINFTINDATLIGDIDDIYDSNYSDEYESVLIGKTDFDNSANPIVGSNISFTTGDCQYGYDLIVNCKTTNNGHIYLVGNNNTITESSLTLGEVIFPSLLKETSYTLYFDQDTEIYDLYLLSAESPASQETQGNIVESPYAEAGLTRQVTNRNFEYRNTTADQAAYRGGNFYNFPWPNTETEAQLDITLNKGTNILRYNSIDITIKTFSQYVNTNNTIPTFKIMFAGEEYIFTSSMVQTSQKKIGAKNYYLRDYSIRLNTNILESLLVSNTNITLDVYKPASGDNKEREFFLVSTLITYNFDFVNGENDSSYANCIFMQNLLNPYYSLNMDGYYDNDKTNFKVTYNSTGRILTKYGTQSLKDFNMPNDSGDSCTSSSTLQMTSKIIFTPYYMSTHYDQGDVEFNYVNFAFIPLVKDGVVENLSSGMYDDLSDIGKYIIRNYLKEQNDGSFITNGVDSFVEFCATGNGTISIKYEDDVIDTIHVLTNENEYKWYEIESASNYEYEVSPNVSIKSVYVVPRGVTIDYINNSGIDKIIANETDVLLNLDYSSIKDANLNNNKLEQFNTTYGVNYDIYQLFSTIYSYYRHIDGKTCEELHNNDVFETAITLIGTIKQDIDNPSYYSLFGKTPEFNKDKWSDLIKLISIADYKGTNSSFKKLYNGVAASNYLNLLNDLCDNQALDVVKQNTVYAIYNYANELTHRNSDLALYIYAAYLGNNYLENSNLLKNTIMYQILDSYSNKEYQFIRENGTVDSEKVTALINHLSNSSNINIDGYGIFALSSSHGIGYGIFIPDNMDLSVLDVYYQKATIKDSSNNDVVVLHLIPSVVDGVEQPKSNEWRGGDVLSSAVAGTVDYAFYHDMKQLILSISTDIFELDFNDNSIKSVDDQIDNENGVITYYLSQSALNSLNEGSILTISNKRLANGAKIGTLSDSTVTESTTVSLSGAIIENNGATKHSITKNNAFTVYAEDINVYKNYKLVLLVGAVGFADTNGLTLAIDPATESGKVPASGGKLIATVTGIFPEGMDLEPFIHIIIDGVEYANTDEKTYWTLDPSVSNNGVVNSDGTGATITLLIDKSLPGSDNITFKLDIFDVSETATFKKEKSSGNSITLAIYDGDTIFASTTQVTDKVTEIPFGRAFDYSELTDYASPNFYLYKFEVSDNAKVEIIATKSPITVGTGANERNTGRIQYVVTYNITSEKGSTQTYKHTLQEKEYFASSNFANLYAEGNVVLCLENVTRTDSETVTWDEATVEERLAAWLALNEKTQRPYYLYDGTYTYSSAKDLFTGAQGSSLNDEIKLHVAFNRAKDREPQYRVKYNLTNFYTLGSNVVFSKNATLTSKTAVSETYAGLTVTVSNNDSVGKYTYVYTYKNTGTWREFNESTGKYEDTSYDRYYEFPELIVQKLASTDAMLKNLTFLDQAVTIGNTATVILPNQVLVPGYDSEHAAYYEGNPNDPTSTGDQIYEKVFKSNNREIQVQTTEIVYGNNTDDKSISDYFAIGTVSDADLSDYCPTFKIDSAAQIYKYTTSLKLTGYGEGAQNAQGVVAKTDKAILTNHDDSNTMYIYVPFIDGEGNTQTFLVQLDNSGNWTKVFRPEFDGIHENGTTDDGKSVYIGDFTDDYENGFGAANATGKVVTGTQGSFTVSSSTGKVSNNSSLYMDYIGTPLNEHFWYISYVVFSEDKLAGGTTEGNVRYYHISIIDLTNNIQFYVKVYAPSNTDWNSVSDIYLTLSENIYDDNNKSTKQISAYAEFKEVVSEGRASINGYRLYTLTYDLQSLPKGYFYFNVDLPDGYVASSYTDMANQLKVVYKTGTEEVDLENSDPHYEAEKDAFLPKTAIITQKVNLEIVINKGTIEDKSKWAVAISDNYLVQTKYEGTIPTV